MTDNSEVGQPCEFVALPTQGRRYIVSRRVGLGDVDRSGRLRLDSLAAYLQDVASEDADVSGLDDVFGWIVRRVEVRISRWPRLAETLTLTTFCAGTGSRWAERRTSIHGAEGEAVEGGAIEAAALWVAIDARGRPVRLSEQFQAIYGEAAAGREVSARLSLPARPAVVESREWPLRRVDFDVLGHVNNAAHWCAVEELVGDRRPRAATIEFGLALTESPVVRFVNDGSVLRVWIGESSTVEVRFAAPQSRPSKP